MAQSALLWVFLATLALGVLPLTIIYILAIARAGQDLAAIYDKCGSAFYPFVIANCALNWLLAVALAISSVCFFSLFNYNINNIARQYEILFSMIVGAISVIYGLFSITALAIVPVAMSAKQCSQAIERVSWGQPWLGIVGYINLSLDLIIVVVFGALACMAYNTIDDNLALRPPTVVEQRPTDDSTTHHTDHHEVLDAFKDLSRDLKHGVESLLHLSRADSYARVPVGPSSVVMAPPPMVMATPSVGMAPTHRKDSLLFLPPTADRGEEIPILYRTPAQGYTDPTLYMATRDRT